MDWLFLWTSNYELHDSEPDPGRKFRIRISNTGCYNDFSNETDHSIVEKNIVRTGTVELDCEVDIWDISLYGSRLERDSNPTDLWLSVEKNNYKKNQAGITILQLAYVQQLGFMGFLMFCCLE